MQILFIGDVFARPGRQVLSEKLQIVKEEHQVDLCIANGENAAGGKGINKSVADELYHAGVDVITLGNHAWDNKDILNFIDSDSRVVRAYNYAPGLPGNGWVTAQARNGAVVVVSQLCCRLFMTPVDCPFRRVDDLLDEIGNSSITLVDVHGEATSEKMALGWHMSGRVTAVVGTHTHIPTADERILPGGTAYITDVGMTGSYDSVIGLEIETAVDRFITGMKVPFRIAKKNVAISSVLIEVNERTGKANSIRRLWIPGSNNEGDEDA